MSGTGKEQKLKQLYLAAKKKIDLLQQELSRERARRETTASSGDGPSVGAADSGVRSCGAARVLVHTGQGQPVGSKSCGDVRPLRILHRVRAEPEAESEHGGGCVWCLAEFQDGATTRHAWCEQVRVPSHRHRAVGRRDRIQCPPPTRPQDALLEAATGLDGAKELALPALALAPASAEMMRAEQRQGRLDLEKVQEA